MGRGKEGLKKGRDMGRLKIGGKKWGGGRG
jgi:hypothetical protein